MKHFSRLCAVAAAVATPAQAYGQDATLAPRTRDGLETAWAGTVIRQGPGLGLS